MATPTSLRPLELLWNKLGWARDVVNSDRFPLAQMNYCIIMGSAEAPGNEIGITYTDRRTGELGMLTDNQQEFPSEVLISSFLLLVGPINELVEEHREKFAERLARAQLWEDRAAARRRRDKGAYKNTR